MKDTRGWRAEIKNPTEDEFSLISEYYRLRCSADNVRISFEISHDVVYVLRSTENIKGEKEEKKTNTK